jgi:hypothetical protein
MENEKGGEKEEQKKKKASKWGVELYSQWKDLGISPSHMAVASTDSGGEQMRKLVPHQAQRAAKREFSR